MGVTSVEGLRIAHATVKNNICLIVMAKLEARFVYILEVAGGDTF